MDKLLAKKTFSYPIYRADTEYRYRKIGTPTVFAELLMGLAHNDFPQLANKSLARIAHKLKLDFTFIRYTLENLNDTGLIEHIDLPDKKDDLDKLSLRDLRLTDNGKKFYHEKKMPGRRRTENAEFWFNPLLNEYVSKPKQSASNVEDVVELNCSLFPVDEALLQQLSGLESTNQKWFDAETELEHDGISITCDEDTSLPQTVPVKLTLDGNHYLNIDSSDKLFSHWINTRKPQVIKEVLLEPMIFDAEDAIEWDVDLDLPENGFLSLTLANQESDIRQIGNAVEVKFNEDQEFDDKTPLIVFANIAEAELHDKHLFVPERLDDSDGLTRVFFRFSDNTLFVEKTGCLECYFDHQPYSLPAKILYQESEDLPALSQPNMAVLAFMANFVPATDILKKLPEMTITQASDFAELIKKTWNKPFKPEGWAEKIKPLNNEDDLRQFTECFPKVELGLARLSAEAQRQAFDWAVNNEKSTVHKIPELSELLALHKALGRLNPTALELKDIKPNSLEKISLWQKNVEEINRTFPAISASNGIAKLSEQLKQWQTAVFRLFEPLDETRKFAVLDTNFVRNRPGRLSVIQTEGTVILPQTVLNELDYQKEKFKRDLATAKQTLVEKTEQCEAIVSVDIDAQIADCDARLGRLKAELDAVRTQLTQLNDKERPNG
ncbi:PIN domain-containing protein [Neisseria sp. oral taxon 014]|uniref:PIN domain-containing protein n=1 Tax=Neisseria sp. oral taxon 014 TaxID=641148 RepID=UPI0025E5419F|nr:PIN domain-containing protein [Neisseria sp. oral taxon 014]